MMKSRPSKRRRSPDMRRRRAPRIETLEDRLVFSFVYADWAPNHEPRDDGYTIKKDSEAQTLRVLENDSGYTYWYGERTSQPSLENLEIKDDAEHGSLELTSDGEAIKYTPEKDFTGIDRFTYVVEVDGVVKEADVFVNVVEPLYAMRDWFRVDEDSSENELDVLENDRANASFASVNQVYNPWILEDVFVAGEDQGAELDLRIQSVSQGSGGGTLTISEDGKQLIHTPALGFEGLETFTYVIEDSDGYTSEATARVQVTTVDSGDQTPVWPEQLQQRLLELAVNGHEGQFGTFQPNFFYPYRRYMSSIDLPMFDLAVDSVSATSLLTTASADTFEFDTEDFSTSNNQVEGVDEGDLVKTDGQFLYLVSNWTDQDDQRNHQLVIVDVRDPASPSVLSRYALDGSVHSLHLHGDRVTALSEADGNVVVTALDVSDRTDPTLAYESTISGDLQTTRAIGDYIYVITDTSSAFQMPHLERVFDSEKFGCFFETADQFVERIGDSIADDFDIQIETRDANGVIAGETVELLTATNPDDLWNIGLSTVASFDIAAETAGPADSTTLVHGSTSEIHVSANAIYLMNETWNSRQSSWFGATDFEIRSPTSLTRLEKLAFGSAGEISWTASGAVPGQVLNSFSVDEHDGFLRVATHDGNDNNLYILEQQDAELNIVGGIEGLAPGEQIYSTRFDGDRGFVVTFRKVDPLFVFDLSDPTDPKMLGQLKISGYSNYLHVIDENHLLGIGREANSNGLFQEIQVSIFDISDVENPGLLHRYGFEGGRALWSPLMENAWNLGTHHSVNYFGSHQTLVMPIYEGDHTGWSWTRRGQTAEVSMRILDIDLDDGIESLGSVDFSEAFDPHLARSVRIGDALFSVSPNLIQIHELREPDNKIGEVRIGASATDDIFSMRGAEAETLDVLANDLAAGIDNDAKQVVSIEQPITGGRVEINDDDGTLSFVPDNDFLGPAEFSYVMEAGGRRTTATVRVDVKRSWHNNDNALDVNDDNNVTPRDMIHIVNVLIDMGTGTIDDLESAQTGINPIGSPRLVDVNNDGNVTARDFLLLVNHFIRQHESSSQPASAGLPVSSGNADRPIEAEEVIVESLESKIQVSESGTGSSEQLVQAAAAGANDDDTDEWNSESVDAVFAESAEITSIS